MTVCIAALCDQGKGCVVAADREITMGFPLNIGFEHRESKIERVSKGTAILSSGNALIAEEVIRRARRLIAAAADEDVFRSASCARDTYMNVHIERAEHVILRPRGMTLQDFRDTGVQKLPLPIYQQIDQLFFNFTLNTEFIVAGVDKTGGHIFWVHYHGMQGVGWLECFDKLGYQAIGSGASHAAILLSLGGQHRGLSMAETVYGVYLAKVAAEVAPGVGALTDMAVVRDDGVEFLTEEFIGKLKEFRGRARDLRPDVAALTALFDGRQGAKDGK